MKIIENNAKSQFYSKPRDSAIDLKNLQEITELQIFTK